MTCDEVALAAPAKLNLHLGIYPGRDARGYHRADSLMVALELADRVSIRRTPHEEPSLEMSVDVGVAPERNTAYRALCSLCEAMGRDAGYAVSIEKRIPAQSGLGGASSDAAAVMRGLCTLWGLDPMDSRVVEVAQRIGADVAFFLDAVPTLLVGAGDVAKEKFPPIPNEPVVLVRPDAGVSTPAAYAEFDRMPIEPSSPEPLCAALRKGDVSMLPDLLYNNLEPAAERLVPVCANVRMWLEQQPGVLAARMTGSGSCVFGICADEEAAREVAAAAAGRSWWSCPTSIQCR